MRSLYIDELNFHGDDIERKEKEEVFRKARCGVPDDLIRRSLEREWGEEEFKEHFARELDRGRTAGSCDLFETAMKIAMEGKYHNSYMTKWLLETRCKVGTEPDPTAKEKDISGMSLEQALKARGLPTGSLSALRFVEEEGPPPLKKGPGRPRKESSAEET